jgi:hypothetical protein
LSNELGEQLGSHGTNTHEGCSGCDQGFRHLNVSVVIDPIGQLFREEFWEGITTGEECPFEDLANQVVSVDEVSVCGFVLQGVTFLKDSESIRNSQGHLGRRNGRL